MNAPIERIEPAAAGRSVRRGRRRALAAAAFIALAVAAGLAYQWTRSAPAKPAAAAGPPPGVPVMVAPVKSGAVPLKLAAVGRVEAFSTVNLKSRIDGQIVEVRFKPGERVRKGQTMVLLDPRILEAQVRQAEANLARDRAQLEKAQSDVARYTDLLAKKFVSEAQVEAFRATALTLEATVKADLAALDLARTQLSYTTVQAPLDGIAGAILAHPGTSVKANDTALVVINQLAPIYVAFSIPESQLAEVRAQSATRTLIVEARAPGGGPPVRGQLVFIDNAVDAATGTIVLKAEFPNEEGVLTPGQFFEVSVTLRTLNEALTIPSEALQVGQQGNFVYVAKADNTVEVRRVATTPLDAATLLVQKGLEPGERVVTDGQLRLAPGARIDVRQPGAPGGGAGRADAAKADAAKGAATKGNATKGEIAKGDAGKAEGPKGDSK